MSESAALRTPPVVIAGEPLDAPRTDRIEQAKVECIPQQMGGIAGGFE